jgi:hypothetical protein
MGVDRVYDFGSFTSGISDVIDGGILANKPALSAVICTHNRYQSVSATIRLLLAQDIDRQDYEIIIVDNSTDADAARRFGAQYRDLANFRYVYEPAPGLSNARNVGADLATAPAQAPDGLASGFGRSLAAAGSPAAGGNRFPPFHCLFMVQARAFLRRSAAPSRAHQRQGF